MPTTLPAVNLRTRYHRAVTRLAHNQYLLKARDYARRTYYYIFGTDTRGPQSPLIPAPLTEGAAIPVPREVRVTPAGVQELFDGNSFAVGRHTDKGVGDSAIKTIRRDFVNETALTVEEVAIRTGKGLEAVERMLDGLVKKGELKRSDNIYYKEWLEGKDLDDALKRASDGEDARLARFRAALDGIQGDMDPRRLETPGVGDVVRILTLYARDLFGRENIELLEINPGGFLNLASRVLENRFSQAELPSGYIKEILEGDQNVYDLVLVEGRFEAREKKDVASQNLAEHLAKDEDRVQYFIKEGVERIIFLKLKSNGKTPEGILAIYNPVFFDESNDSTVNRGLKAVAGTVGEALGRRVRPTAERSAEGMAGRVAVPVEKVEESEYDPQKELQFWNWVFSSGKGKNNVGLEAKIGGPVTDAHRRDFKIAMVGRVNELLSKGKVEVFEDAAGATSIASLLLEELKVEVDDGPGVLPQRVLDNLHCTVRDFSKVAVGQAEKAIAEAGFNQIVAVEQGDMFERSERDDSSVDFTVACMAFYCTRERFRAALREWARISKPGAMGWFSMKAEDGDLKVAKNDTIKGVWRSISLWKKIIFPFALGKMIWFLIKRKRAGAFEYARRLDEGFESGRYYAPTQEQLRKDLDEARLQMVAANRSLAGQFFLVEWNNPKKAA